MAEFSPMMQQYLKIKNDYKNCLVFFRMGDFYELFFDDAIIASTELEIVLTGRDCGQEEKAPMCGIPYHSAEGYIGRLIEKGFKVAICEQTSDPKASKGIVDRAVVRVVTPGTIIDTASLASEKNNYIMSIFKGKDKKGYGVSFADVSTGEFLTSSIKHGQEYKILDEIAKFMPSEVISNEYIESKEAIECFLDLKISITDDWSFDEKFAEKLLCDHLKVHSLDGFGLEGLTTSICAAGALLQYLLDTQKNSLSHINKITNIANSGFMELDVSSRRNLELSENAQNFEKRGSLLWVLDKTKTKMGTRLMRSWIEQPLIDEEKINARLNAVEEFSSSLLKCEDIKDVLVSVGDLERIVAKIVFGSANARDFVNLKNSISAFPVLLEYLSGFENSLVKNIYNSFDTLVDIYAILDKAFLDEPPFSIREGGFINSGFNEQLDKYRIAKTKGSTWLLEVEAKERELTGIKSLKIKYNKVFGYHIEVTNSFLSQVPERYIRRQTLSNCERYVTEELKEIEDAILGADEKINEIEYKLFMDVREHISKDIARIQGTASSIGIIDVLLSFVEVAVKNRYVKPIIATGGDFEIKDGRHPVVEHLTSGVFIENDTTFNETDNTLAIITGPNMAGKSTYMRQTALIVLMAQIGSYVPASSARITIVDRIFTRVGASDDLATGKSTFMVEMSEVANILNNATKDSLLILDEIGRGTSTFDGLSIAWSVLEYIAKKIKAKTLFATHYHELTELEGKVKGVKNYSITVREQGDEIIFLRKIVRGGIDNSYGLQVAKLAGVPNPIIDRAKEILNVLNEKNITKKKKAIVPEENQMSYLDNIRNSEMRSKSITVEE